MATPNLRKLEEQLTCAVCLGHYTSPKTLPCLHTFCQSCLEGILVTGGERDSFITCPQCRTRSPVPHTRGVAGFTDAFHIKNLKEVHDLLTKASDPQHILCDNCHDTGEPTGRGGTVTQHCKDCSQFLCQKCVDVHRKWAPFADHSITDIEEIQTFASHLFPSSDVNCTIHGKSLELFCEICSEVICKDCVDETHKGHHTESVIDSYHKHCQKLEAALNPVTSSLANALTVLSGERETEIKRQRDTVREEIHSMVEGMISLLHQTQQQLTREVDSVTERKLQAIFDMKKSAETGLNNLQDCEDHVEQSLKVNTPEQILASMRLMIERMSQVTQEVNVPQDYSQMEEADMQVVQDRNAVNSLAHIGDVVFYSHGMLQQCKVRIDSTGLERREHIVSFPLLIEFSDSSLITAPLSSITCSVVANREEDTVVTATMSTTAHPGIFMVHCTPVIRGRSIVTVKVNNVQLEGASLVIPFSPFLDTQPVHIMEGFRHPNGIVITNDEHIIVTENRGGCVSVLDKEGRRVKKFGGRGSGESFLHPRGLALTSDGCFLVLDDHRVRKMNMQGECLASAGHHGNGIMEFSYPGGITVSPSTGRVWITDYCNHRVHVLNEDLSFAFVIGTGNESSREGEFNGPTSVVIDKRGMVYVADCDNDRIQKFTEEGVFVAQFGTQGSELGQFRNPVRLILDSKNLLYITECGNHRVSVFTTDGHFVYSFGSYGNERNQFDTPFGMEFDKDGYLYICDLDNDRVVVY